MDPVREWLERVFPAPPAGCEATRPTVVVIRVRRRRGMPPRKGRWVVVVGAAQP
jgi:hypothetical protein